MLLKEWECKKKFENKSEIINQVDQHWKKSLNMTAIQITTAEVLKTSV